MHNAIMSPGRARAGILMNFMRNIVSPSIVTRGSRELVPQNMQNALSRARPRAGVLMNFMRNVVVSSLPRPAHATTRHASLRPPTDDRCSLFRKLNANERTNYSVSLSVTKKYKKIGATNNFAVARFA